jgi:hypothetical protein
VIAALMEAAAAAAATMTIIEQGRNHRMVGCKETHLHESNEKKKKANMNE